MKYLKLFENFDDEPEEEMDYVDVFNIDKNILTINKKEFINLFVDYGVIVESDTIFISTELTPTIQFEFTCTSYDGQLHRQTMNDINDVLTKLDYIEEVDLDGHIFYINFSDSIEEIELN